MATTALRHVPVLMVGTWHASTGTEPITDADLESIVAAANSGLLDPGIISKGHADPRFKRTIEDGSPAFGQVKNPVVEDGILYVDYDPIDEDLAESLPVAYPRCSVELARDVTLLDADGEQRAHFDCVLTAVALLGDRAPAVQGLSNHAAFSAGAAEGRTLIGLSQFAAVRAFSFPGGNTANSLGEKLSAVVREQHGGDFTYTFVEDFDDTTVVFASLNDAGEAYYRQSYTADGNTIILTGELVPVVRETKWVSEKDTTATSTPEPQGMSHAMSALSTKKDQTDPDKNPAPAKGEEQPTGETETPTPDPNPAPDESASTEGQTMPVNKDKAEELRKKYNLDEKATAEDILNAIIEKGDPSPKPIDVAPGSDEGDNAERVKAQQEEAEARAEAASNPNLSRQTPGKDEAELPEALRGKYVSASAFAAFQSEHEAMRKQLSDAREAADKKRRDEKVQAWFSTGRVGTDEYKTVREQLDKNEDVTSALIESRAPLFSTREKGHGYTDPAHFAADTNKVLTEAQFAADDAVFGSTK